MFSFVLRGLPVGGSLIFLVGGQRCMSVVSSQLTHVFFFCVCSCRYPDWIFCGFSCSGMSSGKSMDFN